LLYQDPFDRILVAQALVEPSITRICDFTPSASAVTFSATLAMPLCIEARSFSPISAPTLQSRPCVDRQK
jgi:hypothetical protein